MEGQINLIVVSLSGLSNAATKMAKSCAQLRHGSGLHHLRVYKWFGCVPQPVFRWYMCVLVKFSVYFFYFMIVHVMSFVLFFVYVLKHGLFRPTDVSCLLLI